MPRVASRAVFRGGWHCRGARPRERVSRRTPLRPRGLGRAAHRVRWHGLLLRGSDVDRLASSMPHPLRRIRQYFVVGLVVVTPLGATIFVLAWAFRTIDAILGRPLEQSLGVRVPGLGIVILALLVLLVGSAVQNAVSRRVVQTWNTALSRLPLTRRIYNAGSQIVQALLAGDRRMLVCLVLRSHPLRRG